MARRALSRPLLFPTLWKIMPICVLGSISWFHFACAQERDQYRKLPKPPSAAGLCWQPTDWPLHAGAVFLPNTTFLGRFAFLETAMYLPLLMHQQTQLTVVYTQIRQQHGKCKSRAFRKQSSGGLNSRNLPGWHLKVGGGVQDKTNKSKSPQHLKQEPNLKTLRTSNLNVVSSFGLFLFHLNIKRVTFCKCEPWDFPF